jgi:hypothetical protein
MMYGKISTAGDNPHWRIASTSVQRSRTDPRSITSDLLNFYGYNDVRPQFERDFSIGTGYKDGDRYDNFFSDVTNWTLLPIYWGGTAWSTAVSIVNFIALNIPGGIWHAFGAVQWGRGAWYFTWGAKQDWNTLIGAYKDIDLPAPGFKIESRPNFPWIAFVQRMMRVRFGTDSDGLIEEEAQKYKGTNSLDSYRADGMSHNMSANHPQAKRQFERAFDDQNLPFYTRKRR